MMGAMQHSAALVAAAARTLQARSPSAASSAAHSSLARQAALARAGYVAVLTDSHAASSLRDPADMLHSTQVAYLVSIGSMSICDSLDFSATLCCLACKQLIFCQCSSEAIDTAAPCNVTSKAAIGHRRSGGSLVPSERSNLSKSLSHASNIPSDGEDEDEDAPRYPRPVDLFNRPHEADDAELALPGSTQSPQATALAFGPHGPSPLAPTSANLRRLLSHHDGAQQPLDDFLAGAEQGMSHALHEHQSDAASNRDTSMSMSFAHWNVPLEGRQLATKAGCWLQGWLPLSAHAVRAPEKAAGHNLCNPLLLQCP